MVAGDEYLPQPPHQTRKTRTTVTNLTHRPPPTTPKLAWNAPSPTYKREGSLRNRDGASSAKGPTPTHGSDELPVASGAGGAGGPATSTTPPASMGSAGIRMGCNETPD